ASALCGLADQICIGANRLINEIRDKIRLGVFVYREYFDDSGNSTEGDVTLKQQMKTWLAAQNLEASTLDGYASGVKFWTNAPYNESGDPLGDVPIKGLVLSQIKRAIAIKAATPRGITGKTINNYVSVLKRSLDLAVKDKLIKDNPADDEEELRAEHQEEPPDPFDKVEAGLIIDFAREHYPEQIYNQIDFWIHTGLRTSEMAGVRWGSVDWRKETIRIHTVNVRGREKKRTKTKKPREVKLNSKALAALQRQKSHTFLAGEHIWLDPRYGTPWNEERAFRRSYWTPSLKRLGIRYRRPYQCRHTYATMLLMAGAQPAYAARQMGHSVQMFLKTYAIWIDDDHSDIEQKKLEAFLSTEVSGRRIEAL
ncbi:MAG: tyrosine-type recombinase/integrase, partial [Comamonas sp.]